MSLFVSTVSSNVVVPELGITLTHPTVNFQVDAQFSSEEIKKANSLTYAIQAGTLTWKYTSTGTIQNATSYDADTVEIEQEKTGYGIDTVAAYTLAATTISLKIGDNDRLFFSGTVVGQIINLPIATGAPLGLEYSIFNNGNKSITVNNQDGTFLFTSLADSKTVFTLEDTSTANGSWFILQSFNNVANGILNYKITSSTPFATTSPSDVIITGFTVTPIAGTYACWYNADVLMAVSPQNHSWSIFKAAALVADSKRTQISSRSNQPMTDSTMSTVQVNGTQTIDIRVNSASGTLTINARTLILIRLGA